MHVIIEKKFQHFDRHTERRTVIQLYTTHIVEKE